MIFCIKYINVLHIAFRDMLLLFDIVYKQENVFKSKTRLKKLYGFLSKFLMLLL
jgi:hypothetical protein